MGQLHKKYNFILIICLSNLFFCSTNVAVTVPPSSPHHFVLVHGAGHGAWCWFELVNLLRSSGERVTALDMAASGIDPQEANNLRSVADYFQPLIDFMTALPPTERVILVGHSYGGIGLAYSMELFPEKITVAVFISALMPCPTLNVTSVYHRGLVSVGSALDSTYSYNNGSNNPPTSLLFGPSLLAPKFYQLSPVDDLLLATLLIRRFPLFTNENLSEVIRPTKESSSEAATVVPSPSPEPGHHFVLVHGAGHGAWCWFELVNLLRSSGERVTALDMASSGIDPQEANNLRSVADYFQPLTDFMTAQPSTERVILVGHSFGGYGLTYSMELFPEKIVAAVFVTALMPGPALNVTSINQRVSLGSVLDGTYSYNNGSNNPPTSFLSGPSLLATKFYQLSPVDDLVLATLLIRRFPLFTDENLSEVIRPTKERYGRVKRVFIVSGQDEALKVDIQEWMIQGNPPNEVFNVNGSDHMVMLSKPTELQGLLSRIARKYS